MGFFKNLLGSAESQGVLTPPVVAPPTPMPTPNDDAAQQAKRKAQRELAARRGRQSTILTQETTGDLLGG